MLRLGKMYTGSDEYNIFILENSAITRFEIGDSKSRWQDLNSTILYGEYKRQSLRIFGDGDLAQLYRKTVDQAKALNCSEKINAKWVDGILVKETVKYKSEDEYYSYMDKSGVFYSELCKYGGVLIEIFMYEEDYSLDLSPLNHEEYKWVRNKKETPASKVLRDNAAADWENCLYVASELKDIFLAYVRKDIDIASDEAISFLFYAERGMPAFKLDANGMGSVKEKVIRELAGIVLEAPLHRFADDIRDSNGKLILRANVLNSAKYPEAILLRKYRYYAAKAAALKNNKQ